nr:myomodulin, MMD=peptide cotransmitter [Aplysia californica=mollusk, B16 accessory radula closer (ARC) muscle, Peptide, 7 aa] [Aplysia californica]
GLSMLRL